MIQIVYIIWKHQQLLLVAMSTRCFRLPDLDTFADASNHVLDLIVVHPGPPLPVVMSCDPHDILQLHKAIGNTRRDKY